MDKRKFFHSAAAFGMGLALLSGHLAQAQTAAAPYPSKPIRLVVPYPPAGATDVIGRMVAQKLSTELGQQVIVENKGGAGGSIGAAFVANSPPDGYTLLLGALTSHSINSALQPNLPFDLGKDFAPIGIVGQVPLVFVVHPDLPVKSLKELMAYAKANPGLSMASSGNGSPQHMALELFKATAKVDMLHVPYKGSGPAMADLLGGQVKTMIETTPSALPQIKAGKLRALAVTTNKRFEYLPDVPTTAEAGLPDFVVTSMFGLLAPSKTAPAIVAKLAQALEKIINTPEVKEQLLAQGVMAEYIKPDESRRRIQAEVDKWTRVAREAHIKLDQ